MLRSRPRTAGSEGEEGVAPQGVWDQLVTTKTYHLHSQVSFHDLVPAIEEIPYEAIAYFEAA